MPNPRSSKARLVWRVVIAGLVPIFLSATFLVYQADPYDPAPFPAHEFTSQKPSVAPPFVNARMLHGSKFVGSGRVSGPEDLAYEPESRVLYTGCADGWIKRLHLTTNGDAKEVEDWVNTGGRPLGISIVGGSHLLVADAYKGLLKITMDKQIEVLADSADGLKFKLTDGLDVAKDGTIYFTDASFKYTLHQYLDDLLESRPYGRLVSFDPNTNTTKVLLKHLYFPNGIAVSPDHQSLVFCETPLKRCRRYWLHGSSKGSVDAFVDNLPGFPDNIHSNGQSNYWIAISSSPSPLVEQVTKAQSIRKGIMIMERYVSLLKHFQRNGGFYSVDLQGNPIAHIYDPAVKLISSVIRIRDHLYLGSLHYPHIIRFNLSYS